MLYHYRIMTIKIPFSVVNKFATLFIYLSAYLAVLNMTELFGFRVVPLHLGNTGLHKQWHQLNEHHNHWWKTLSVRVRPGNQIVPSFSLQLKSDESTKNFLTQMLLAINWRYWQREKITLACEVSRSSHASASLKSTRFLQKKGLLTEGFIV